MKIDELVSAMEFVEVGRDDGAHEAYVCRQTGEIVFSSDDGGFDPLPDDIADRSKYLEVPDKFELELGKTLAVRFVSEYLPDDVEDVYAFFRRRRAYRNFTGLLATRDMLREWFAYEAEATREAALRWCGRNKLKVDD